MPPKTLIFDLDGTLIDSAGDLHRCVNHALAQYSLEPLSLEVVRGMIGDGVRQLLSRAFAARSHPIEDIEVRRFMAYYSLDPVALTAPYEGVSGTLHELSRRGFRMAVCTNKPQAISKDVLQRVHLAPYFKHVLGGDSRPYRKPDPRLLLDVVELMKSPIEDCVLIGDSEVDAETATAAGVPFVLMTYGYRRGPAKQIAAVARLRRFAQLVSQFSG